MKCELYNRLPLNKMLVNNSLQSLSFEVVVPGSFGINDSDGTLLAQAQTVNLCALNRSTRTSESS
jgi:hypothetical protein